MDYRTLVPEQAVIDIRKQLQEALGLLDNFSAMYDRSKQGERISSSDLNEPVFALQHLLTGPLNMDTFHLSMYFTVRAMDEDFERNRYEWIKNGRKFAPKSAMEHDLWDHFHEFKEQGFSVMVFYSDSFQSTHPIVAIGKGENIEEALEEVRTIGMTRIMAVMDLHKTFEEQWPYIPGTIHAPIQLTERPLITIPRLLDAKPHEKAPHLRSVPGTQKPPIGISPTKP